MTEDQKLSKSEHPLMKLAVKLGIPALVLGVIAVLVLYWATNKQVERANQQVADLLARLGSAQERATQLEKQQTELQAQMARVDELARRLRDADPDKVTKLLDLANRPEANISLEKDRIIKDVKVLQRLMAFIYESAYWAHDKPVQNNPNALRNCLSYMWASSDDLRSKPYSTLDEKLWEDTTAAMRATALLQKEREKLMDFSGTTMATR